MTPKLLSKEEVDSLEKNCDRHPWEEYDVRNLIFTLRQFESLLGEEQKENKWWEKKYQEAVAYSIEQSKELAGVYRRIEEFLNECSLLDGDSRLKYEEVQITQGVWFEFRSWFDKAKGEVK